jgi:16S rRNA (guanine527-N7)-methyltransferase
LDEKRFLETILGLTAECGIPFSAEQALRCCEHVQLMLQWNRSVNLTRIIDLREIIIQHLLDSLIPACTLPDEGTALDIGSGAGFPGIPMKILHPGINMTLLEAHRKKVSFLKAVIAKRETGGITALQGRWEELVRSGHSLPQGHFTVLTMRALRLEPDHLAILASRLLEPGGVFAWWAGPQAADDPEINLLAREAGFIYQEPLLYNLPGKFKPRRLLMWRKP